MSRQRLINVFCCLFAVLAIGSADLIVIRITGIGIPCIFSSITGLSCPGCGMTRAIIRLLYGDIAGAAQYNVLVVGVLPILCIYLIYRLVRYVRCDDDGFHIWEYALLMILLVLTLGYGVMRNITI